MRDENDLYRHHVPLLRRVIIVVAVLAAVPVVLWTITSFVRSYVGPPRIPSYRPMAVAAPTAANAATPALNGMAMASAQQSAPETVSSIVEARATATDARGLPPANPPAAGERNPSAGNPPDTAPTAGATSVVPASLKLATASPETPEPAAPIAAPAAQKPVAIAESPEADSVEAGVPLAGPIPLPRHRPRSFTLADSGIPTPRARPGAGTAEPEASPSALDWIRRNLVPHQE